MVSSLSNPHIYISPCALLNYARLLDYFDAILALEGGDGAPVRTGGGAAEGEGSMGGADFAGG